MEKGIDGCILPATHSGLRPADFPLGSLESRAAARVLLAIQANRAAVTPRHVYPPGWSPKTAAQRAALDSPSDQRSAGTLRSRSDPGVERPNRRLATDVPNAAEE